GCTLRGRGLVSGGGRWGRGMVEVGGGVMEGSPLRFVTAGSPTCDRAVRRGDGKVVLKKIGNLARRNVSSHTTSPTACDFDQDGKPDLVLGAENGLLYFIEHDNCIHYSKKEIQARPPKAASRTRFPGLLHEEFVFEKANFPQCHASTLCETPRGLVVAWFGGTRERNPDVGIWSSYYDGGGWSAPQEQANGIQHEGLRYPCWNQVLYKPQGDGATMLFFKVGPTPSRWWGELVVSYDGGRSFRDRRRLPEGIDGPVRGKPSLLADGSLLCPASTEHDDDWRFHFERLIDLCVLNTFPGPPDKEKFYIPPSP
ncbi:MAG: exo-alpha-sialidase, partial [Pirellulales bacterium]|nr:exo-alpha-sialidase [Pirellulales bacterium]